MGFGLRVGVRADGEETHSACDLCEALLVASSRGLRLTPARVRGVSSMR